MKTSTGLLYLVRPVSINRRKDRGRKRNGEERGNRSINITEKTTKQLCGRRGGSVSEVLALQAQRPQFNTQSSH